MAKPKIRFKGYTDDWEQRKLGEIASSFEYGLNAAAKEYDGENKYIRITDIDDNTHEFLTYNLTSPDIDLTDVENYKLAEGDILFARTGASVGKSYIYRDSDGLVYYAGFLIRARIREEYDAEFVFQSTLTDKYNKYIAVTSQRSGQPGVNAQEYSEFEIRVPEKEEQTKIGTYFHNLDHLITLHQRKCEETKKLKKYMLQKMFPQNGQTVPEIRFAGFTDAWEQRKLGDLVGIYDGVHQTPDYQDSGIMFLSVENIATLKSEKYISEEAFERDYNVYPEKGDILMTRIGDVGTTNVVETAEKVAFYVSLALLKPNGIDSYFLSNAMKTNDFQKGLRERTLVTAIPQKINKDDIGKINIFITNNDEEQKKIGAYFSSLDHLITLHQCKCHLLLKLLHNDWEQRKLGEVFKEYSEKGHTELPTLTIIQGGGTVKREDSDRNLMYDETNLSNYKMVRKDDFIVHLRSFEGGLEKASLDGIISPAYHTFHSDEADSRFYYPYFRSFEFIKHKLVPHVYGIRDGRSIDIEGMKSIEIPYTSLSEQRKIGDYLELLDHLITLHHRKYIYILKSP